ncbi:CNPV141 HAL3-like domain protein [Neoconidiobolus thromboides FSU 785]|nr:CNPV141 HAL3-like domain protein [Neoconidiobolus thromboides FSU 785]
MQNLLIGVTGSVASIKLPLLVEELVKKNKYNIKIVTTESAKHFYKDYIQKNTDGLYLTVGNSEIEINIYDDKYEWESWNKIGDPVQHIELRKWTSLFLIAPLDANTLAKIANGMCDNLLTSILRAWDIEDQSKKIIIAPAMNTLMWNNPFTQEHLIVLKQKLNVQIIEPTSKLLACGDLGVGAMASVDTIVEMVQLNLNK